MNRREFLKFGSLGLAGLALSGKDLAWLMRDASAAAAQSGAAWRFGVMADTQWKTVTDSFNPGTCAIEIIQALNAQFIQAGVKFVVQVGDLVDKESWTNFDRKAERTLPYRADAAQSLYDAGIGFFPLRGNHEATATAALELPTLFPQTLGEGDSLFGVDRVLPSSISSLRGLSYAFDFGNVRIVLIDQFTRQDGTGSTNDNAVDQVDWVDSVLAERPSDSHAFVMAHKNLIGQNHTDCLFGADVRANIGARNRFIGSLQANGVGYYLGGHDHMHHRSRVASPDGSATTEQIICSSNSYKFYIPKTGSSHPDAAGQAERPIAQELFTIGYYLFTVEGPCVTVEFYSSSHGVDYGDFDLLYAPAQLTFHLRERFGYSLNGQSFEIANGESYTQVQDSYQGTSMRILSGLNETLAQDVDYNDRSLIKSVKTGWKDRPAGAASAVLKLWGMADNLSLHDAGLSGLLPDAEATCVTDTYVLSLSYDASAVRPSALRGGAFCLRAKDAGGHWVKAVDLNQGGTRGYVYGPWRAGYGLGTYGVDPNSRTVWAVLDHDGEFVAG